MANNKYPHARTTGVREDCFTFIKGLVKLQRYHTLSSFWHVGLLLLDPLWLDHWKIVLFFHTHNNLGITNKAMVSWEFDLVIRSIVAAWTPVTQSKVSFSSQKAKNKREFRFRQVSGFPVGTVCFLKDLVCGSEAILFQARVGHTPGSFSMPARSESASSILQLGLCH